MSSSGVPLNGIGAFTVMPEHPALPGHFPDQPIVPGVVVLDNVFALAGVPRSRERSIPWVKFVRPLLPGQTAEVSWALAGTTLKFTVRHGGTEIVRGQVSIAPSQDAS